MKRREIVERYLAAWNQRDAAAVLELLSPGAAVYDALWRESCVGSSIPKYVEDALDEGEYWYELTDELIYFDEGVVYRYAAYECDGELADRSLTVAGLAEEVGCSVEHLLRLVKEEFGTDVEAFVGREHARYAVELLDS